MDPLRARGLFLPAAAALVLGWSVAVGGADADGRQRELASPVDGHRPLRSHEGAAAAPSVPQPFAGYVEAPAFDVVPREGALGAFYPCGNCHAQMPVNSEPRRLYAPHQAALKHGGGRIWCLDCHNAEDRNQLTTLAGDPVSFNEAYLVCGQCHYQPQKDWYFGAHGKRVGNWRGERTFYSCTHCHNPHDPALEPRAPEPPPPVRAGLEPMPRDDHHHEDGVLRGLSLQLQDVDHD